MSRVQLLVHKGRKVILTDCSGLVNLPDMLATIEESRKFWAAQPRFKSYYGLVDGTGASFDSGVVDALKALAKQNEPWAVAGAVVTTSGLQRVVLRVVNSVTGRNLRGFATRAEALEWLGTVA